MRVRILLVVGLLLAWAFAVEVSAQDNKPDYTGSYQIAGDTVDGDGAYSGVLTITGEAPMVNVQFALDDDDYEISSPAFLIGNTLIDGAGDDTCSETYYRILPSGKLLGLVIDVEFDNVLFVETLTPIGETDGLVGKYEQFTFIDQSIEEELPPITVDIMGGENDIYQVTYMIPLNEAGDEVLAIEGTALLQGDLLGLVTASQDIDTFCSIYVGKFDGDGGYKSRFADEFGHGSEVGTRQE